METALERLVARARTAAIEAEALPVMDDTPDPSARLDDLESVVADLESRLATLEEAGTQDALAGMVPDGMTAGLPEPAPNGQSAESEPEPEPVAS